MKLCLVAVLAFALLVSSNAEVFTGTFNGEEGLLYMGKFCYGWTPQGGSAAGQFLASAQVQSTGVSLVLFDDQSDSWPTAISGSCDCTCATNAARISIPLVPGDNSDLGGPGHEIYEHLRPRFWYAALLSCNTPISATYSIDFEQFDGSQVGVNQQGMFATYMVMFFLWLFGFGAQLWASRWLWRSRTFHPIIKIFCLSVGLWTLGITSNMIHWATYSGNGIGAPFLHSLGELLMVLARICFMLLVMCIASGWTISSKLLQNRREIFTAILVILLCYCVLVFWDIFGRDPASTTFVYDSVVGVLICMLHLAICAWFIWRVRKTREAEAHTDRRSFYKAFGIMYSLWFLLLPFVVFIGAVTNPWSRLKAVEASLLCLDTIAVGVLGFYLWPSRAARYFDIQADYFVDSTQQYDDL